MPQRLWYFVLRRGRVGRCQVCKTQLKSSHHTNGPSRTTRAAISGLSASCAAQPDNAGWSSPVARQAHNLKAAGSNPAPATNDPCDPHKAPSWGFLRFGPPVAPARPISSSRIAFSLRNSGFFLPDAKASTPEKIVSDAANLKANLSHESVE